jgi:small subunit ribosomal protein S25
MPFMHGRAAISRTLEHLQKGQIVLKKQVRIMMFAFNVDAIHRKFPQHYGLRNFVLWHVPQLQYMNPNVQILTLDGLTPNPWIKAFCDDDVRVVIDCYGRSREEIHEHVKHVLGKTESMLKAEAEQATMLAHNPANFGPSFDRHCVCEMPGQVPCPAWQALPLEMTGKGKRKLLEQAQEAEAAAKSAAAGT